MGRFLSRGRAPRILFDFLVPQFLVQPGAARFFIPTLHPKSPARAEAVKDGASAPPKASSLDGFEHDAAALLPSPLFRLIFDTKSVSQQLCAE